MVYVKSKILKTGVYLFALVEWIYSVGYTTFLWSENSFQNFMHQAVAVVVVVQSVVSLVVIFIGASKEELNSLSIWALICLLAMLTGPLGMNMFPSLFGLFERFSSFSTVIFNAVLGIYLIMF